MPNRFCFAVIGLLAAAIAARVTGEFSVTPVVLQATAAQTKPAPQTPAKPAPQTSTPPAAQSMPGGGYVGQDTCVGCHDQGETLKGTPHAQAKDPRSPAAGHGCESCHGPGQAHVDDDDKKHIRKFSTITPGEVNETCLSCHNRGNHAGWEGSAHERRNLSCTSCHSVHSPKAAERQLKAPTETALCATCHRVQVTKTERAVAHMPVREGKMSCSSCHNPHGSISNVKSLRVGSSVAESCMSCHAEMRGPMLWEHAPVKENCATCHDPHGSSNDRMLVVRMPMLCQRCHIATRHPSSIYDNNAITVNKSNRMFGRSCVNCHSNVHGSNHPSGQFFMR
ncbi:MAG TPA: DmsE family decaheme c-type cytochrome [Vicinamibacterales bacterium]|nr:DmsE family decaheme c-type cytochrome [Vicinamibacterales bacterium]